VNNINLKLNLLFQKCNHVSSLYSKSLRYMKFINGDIYKSQSPIKWFWHKLCLICTCINCDMAGATDGAEAGYHSRAHELTPQFLVGFMLLN